jgi:hypothetical protein
MTTLQDSLSPTISLQSTLHNVQTLVFILLKSSSSNMWTAYRRWISFFEVPNNPLTSTCILRSPFLNIRNLKSTIFSDITTCSVVYPKSTDASMQHITSILRADSTLAAIYSSETSVCFQWTAPHVIPEDCIFHNHRCDNLKSYIFVICFSLKTRAFIL